MVGPVSTPRPIATQPERDAAPAVRGFVYQVDQTVLAWLALRDDEWLYIELGEDFAIERRDPVALLQLAQVKDVAARVSLRSDDVIEAILNLADHRARNPGVSLQMDFLTSAGIATERPTTLKMPGLIAWERIAARAAGEDALFKGVVRLLRTAKTERREELRALLANRGALLRPLVPLLQWRTSQPPGANLEAEVRTVLVHQGHIDRVDEAVAAHDVLFSYVFRQLADPAREPLRRQDIAAVLTARQAPLRQRVVEQEKLLEGVVARLARVEASLAFDPRDEILDLSSVLARTDLPLFTGRAGLIARLHHLIPGGGLALIEARAGGGKSALVAYLHATYGWPAHFAELSRRTQDLLRSLAAQIAWEHGDDDWLRRVRNRQLDAPASFWSGLSALAGRLGRPLVVLIDGLDEMDEERELLRGAEGARGVLCVVTRRPGGELRGAHRLTIEDAANEVDIAAWLPRRARAEPLRSRLATLGLRPERLVSLLLGKVGANWKYADAVLRTIEQSESLVVAIEDLPAELVDWYRLWWQRWRQDHEPTWDDSDLRLLGTLVVAAEPLNVKELAELSGVLESMTRRRMRVGWVSFLVIDGRGRIRPDHQAFREFLGGEWEARTGDAEAETLRSELEKARHEAEKRILRWYLERWGGLEAGLPRLREPQFQSLHDGYGVRHLVRHAARVDFSTLKGVIALEWEEAGTPRSALELVREAMGDAPLYRDDLLRGRLAEAGRRRAFDKLMRVQSGEPGDGAPPSVFELQLAFALSSLIEVRGAIVPGLARLAFRTGLWSLEQALDHVRRLRADERAMGLAMLAAEVGTDREGLANEALTAIRQIRNSIEMFPVVRRLADVLSEPTRGQVLAESCAYAMRLIGSGSAVALFHLGDVLSDEARTALAGVAADRADHRFETSVPRAGLLRWLPPGPVRECLLDRLLLNGLNAPLVFWLRDLGLRIRFVDPGEFEVRARADGLLAQLTRMRGRREAWSTLLGRLSPLDAARWLVASRGLPQVARKILTERAAITDGAQLAAAMKASTSQGRDGEAFAHLNWLPVAARGGAAAMLLSQLDRTPDPREIRSSLDALAECNHPPREAVARLLAASRTIGDGEGLDRARCALAWAQPMGRREQLRDDAWARIEAEARMEEWCDVGHLLPVARQIHGLPDEERREVVARLLATLEDAPTVDDEVLGALLMGATTTEEAHQILPRIQAVDAAYLHGYMMHAAGGLRGPDAAILASHLYDLEDDDVRIVAVLARDHLPPSSFADLWRGVEQYDDDTRAVLGAVLAPLAPPKQRSGRLREARSWLEATRSAAGAAFAAALLFETTEDQSLLDQAAFPARERAGTREALLARALLARLDVPHARRWWESAMQHLTETPLVLDENLLLSELLRVPASQALPALEALTEVISTTERSKTASLLCAVSPWLAAIGADEFARSLVRSVDLAQRWWP